MAVAASPALAQPAGALYKVLLMLSFMNNEFRARAFFLHFGSSEMRESVRETIRRRYSEFRTLGSGNRDFSETRFISKNS